MRRMARITLVAGGAGLNSKVMSDIFAALPEDTKLVRVSDNNDPNFTVSLLFESEDFKELSDGEEIPLIPVIGRMNPTTKQTEFEKLELDEILDPSKNANGVKITFDPKTPFSSGPNPFDHNNWISHKSTHGRMTGPPQPQTLPKTNQCPPVYKVQFIKDPNPDNSKIKKSVCDCGAEGHSHHINCPAHPCNSVNRDGH